MGTSQGPEREALPRQPRSRRTRLGRSWNEAAGRESLEMSPRNARGMRGGHEATTDDRIPERTVSEPQGGQGPGGGPGMTQRPFTGHGNRCRGLSLDPAPQTRCPRGGHWTPPRTQRPLHRRGDRETHHGPLAADICSAGAAQPWRRGPPKRSNKLKTRKWHRNRYMLSPLNFKNPSRFGPE